MTAMPLVVDKLLSALAFPLGSACLLALLGALLVAIGWRRRGAVAVVLAVVWLWGWSTVPAATAITALLADPFPARPAEALPRADVIVVLGGGLVPRDTRHPYPDMNEAADRLWHAARLHAAGRAPRILLSGGRVWDSGPQSEADAMAELLIDLGVPATAILIEGDSRNTRENAVQTAAMLARDDLERVLLVTSATHMTRALATFRKAGVDAIPAATDHRPSSTYSTQPLALALLPDAGALQSSTRALKELLGLLVYRWRGWA